MRLALTPLALTPLALTLLALTLLALTLVALTLVATLALPVRADEVPFSPTPSLWQEKMAANFNAAVATVPADALGIVRYPIDHPQDFGKAALLIGALVLFDKPLTEFYQDKIEPIFAGFSLPQAPISWPQYGIVSEDGWLITGVAATYAFGVVAGDDRAQRAALLSAKAVVYSYLTSELVLKTAFARLRPYPDLQNPSGDPNTYTNNPYDFFNWGGSFLSPGRSGRSMPSYHFTEYMSVARVFSGVYDNSPWPYGVAAVLAVSNIQGHHHWVSDMVAGGLIGYGIGSLLLKNDKAYRAGQVQIDTLPIIGPDSAGVAMTMQF